MNEWCTDSHSTDHCLVLNDTHRQAQGASLPALFGLANLVIYVSVQQTGAAWLALDQVERLASIRSPFPSPKDSPLCTGILGIQWAAADSAVA